MRFRESLFGAAVVGVALVLTAAGCGGKDAPAAVPAPPVKHNAAVYTSLDVCGLATDAQLQDVLGEAPGARQQNDDPSFKGCTVVDPAGRFYLFITVRKSPAGGPQQYGYDKAQASSPATVQGVGSAAFSWSDNDEAHLEALDGDLVVGVAFVYYNGGGSVSNGPELIQKLSGLAKALVAKI